MCFHQAQNQCSENKAILLWILVMERGKLVNTNGQKLVLTELQAQSPEPKAGMLRNKRCEGRDTKQKDEHLPTPQSLKWNIYRSIPLWDAQKQAINK